MESGDTSQGRIQHSKKGGGGAIPERVKFIKPAQQKMLEK